VLVDGDELKITGLSFTLSTVFVLEFSIDLLLDLFSLSVLLPTLLPGHLFTSELTCFI
jgi:hypothetical protein